MPNKALLSDKFPLCSKFAAERGVMGSLPVGHGRDADDRSFRFLSVRHREL